MFGMFAAHLIISYVCLNFLFIFICLNWCMNKIKIILALSLLATINATITVTDVALGLSQINTQKSNNLKISATAEQEYIDFLKGATNIDPIFLPTGTTETAIWYTTSGHKYNPQRHWLNMLAYKKASTTPAAVPADFPAAGTLTSVVPPLMNYATYSNSKTDLSNALIPYKRQKNDITGDKFFYLADADLTPLSTLTVTFTPKQADAMKSKPTLGTDGKVSVTYTLKKDSTGKYVLNTDTGSINQFNDDFASFLFSLSKKLSPKDIPNEYKTAYAFLSLYAKYGTKVYDFNNVADDILSIQDNSAKQSLMGIALTNFQNFDGIISQLQKEYNQIILDTVNIVDTTDNQIGSILSMIVGLRKALGITDTTGLILQSDVTKATQQIKEFLSTSTSSSIINNTVNSTNATQQAIWELTIPSATASTVAAINNLDLLKASIPGATLSSLTFNTPPSTDSTVTKIVSNLNTLLNAMKSATPPTTIFNGWNTITSKELKRYSGLRYVVENMEIFKDTILGLPGTSGPVFPLPVATNTNNALNIALDAISTALNADAFLAGTSTNLPLSGTSLLSAITGTIDSTQTINTDLITGLTTLKDNANAVMAALRQNTVGDVQTALGAPATMTLGTAAATYGSILAPYNDGITAMWNAIAIVMAQSGQTDPMNWNTLQMPQQTVSAWPTTALTFPDTWNDDMRVIRQI